MDVLRKAATIIMVVASITISGCGAGVALTNENGGGNEEGGGTGGTGGDRNTRGGLGAARDEEKRETRRTAQSAEATTIARTVPSYVTRTVTGERSALTGTNVKSQWEAGWSGKGVRIAVEDDPVDLLRSGTTEEFSGRVSEIGTRYSYDFFPQWAFDEWVTAIGADDTGAAKEAWERRWTEKRADGCPVRLRSSWSCSVFTSEAQAIAEIKRTGGGYATGSRLLLIENQNAKFLGRWRVVMNPRAGGRYHGTQVAAVALGKTYGIAPGAILVPKAVTLGADSEADAGLSALGSLVRGWVLAENPTEVSEEKRAEFDAGWAEGIREWYTNADIINQSYGTPSWSNWNLRSQTEAAKTFWERMRRRLPETVKAYEWYGFDTFVVTAAGNDSDWRGPRESPSVSATDALFLPGRRGLSFAVAALNDDGDGIAAYSNYCGTLPESGAYKWNEDTDGRHYCLAAPGTVKTVKEDGTTITVQGTSFAAPIVSGALALMSERYRGQVSARELGLRMVNTADNSGVFANSAIYGAGKLDINAAMTPQGSMTMRNARLGTPQAFSAAVRGEMMGREIAQFDRDGFPFWRPMSDFIAVPSERRWKTPVPRRREAEEPLADINWLHWSGPRLDNDGTQWRFGAYGGGSQEGMGVGVERSLPMGGLKVGFTLEDGAYQGAPSSGEFGDPRGSMLFVSQEGSVPLGEGWTLNGSWTLAQGHPEYRGSDLMDADPILYSAGSVGIEYASGAGQTRIGVSQPLRAEQGEITFHVPVGRTREGKKLYEQYQVDLGEQARELRYTVRHDHMVTEHVAIAVTAEHRKNANHVRGAEDAFVGGGLSVTW